MQEGLVISGSEDGILHVWDPKEQPRKLPLERKKERKVRRGGQEASKEAEVPSGVTVPVKEAKELSFEELLALHKSEQGKVKEVSPELGKEEQEETERVEKPRQILKPSSNRERKVKTVNKKLYFPVSSNAESKSKSTTLEDCLAVHEYYQSHVKRVEDMSEEAVVEALDNLNLDEGSEGKKKSRKEAGVHLGFFTSREAVYRLLEAERSEQAGDVEAEAVLSLWSGDLGTVIEAAITEARVTERLLAHAAGMKQILNKF